MGKNQPKHNPPKHNPPPKPPPPPPPPPPRPPAPKPAPAPKKADAPKHQPDKKSAPAHKPAQRQTRKADPPKRTPNKPGSNKPANNRQDNRQNNKNKGPQKRHPGRNNKPGHGKGKGKGPHRGNRGSNGDGSDNTTDGGYEDPDYSGPEATPDIAPWNEPDGSGSSEPERRVIAADPDLLLQRVEGAPIELIEEMLFQAIGSLELITIMRDYSFDGQKIFYQPIENLEAINREYNPQTITNPSFNFANWKSLHTITMPAGSDKAIHLEVLPGQINVVVSLPDLLANQLIEVAVSYSPEGLLYIPGFAGEILYDGGTSVEEDSYTLLDGGDASTITWDDEIDAGSSLTYYAIIDGGEALSDFASSVDGGDSLGYNIDRTLIGAGA